MNKLFTKIAIAIISFSLSLISLYSVNANAVTNLAISPIFECGIVRADGNYTAVFGYLNRNDETITVPVGTKNRFNPLPANRNQTTVFAPGRGYAVFAVTEAPSTNLVWSLNHPTNRTATASYSGAVNKPCSPSVAANFPY